MTDRIEERAGTDLTVAERAENEHALDPHEHWGQGTDASHPISAIDAVWPDTPTSAEVTPDDGVGASPDRSPSDQSTNAATPPRRTDPGR